MGYITYHLLYYAKDSKHVMANRVTVLPTVAAKAATSICNREHDTF